MKLGIEDTVLVNCKDASLRTITKKPSSYIQCNQAQTIIPTPGAFPPLRKEAFKATVTQSLRALEGFLPNVRRHP